MNESPTPEGSISEEFRILGRNLVDLLRTAWDSPERKRLQTEIETGLNELGSTVRKEIDMISENPAAQRFKTDVKDLQHKVRSGEVETKVRDEILTALHSVNSELEKFNEKIAGDRESTASTASEGESMASDLSPEQAARMANEQHQEVHPDDVDAKPGDAGWKEVGPDDVDSGNTTQTS